MSLHLLPFYQATGGTTFVQTNALTTEIFPTNANTNYVSRTDLYAVAAVAIGSDLKRAQLTSPSLARITPVQIQQLILSGGIPTAPPITYFLQDPPVLYKEEEFKIQALNRTLTSANYAALIISDVYPLAAPARGPYFWLHGSHTTSCTGNAFTTVTISWDQSIMGGDYFVCGMAAYSSTGLFARIFGPTQVFRPGCVVQQGYGNRADPLFTTPSLSNYYKFNAYQMPSVEFYCTQSDGGGDIFLLVARA